MFGSERLTGALLDRLTHHIHILEMNGDSYRHSRQSAAYQVSDESEDSSLTPKLGTPARDRTPPGSQFSPFSSCRWYTIPPPQWYTFSPPLTIQPQMASAGQPSRKAKTPNHCWTPSPGNTDKKARLGTKYWILPMGASQNPNRATKDDAHRVIGTRRSPRITGAFRYRRAVRPHPQGNQATHQAPTAALVAVHKNTKLVSQFSELVTLGR